MARQLSDAEVAFIIANHPQLGTAETARRAGCSKRTVQRIVSNQEPAPDARQEPTTTDEPQTKHDRLIELRGILRRAMNDAPPQAISGLAREYRETMDEIDRMEGGSDGDPVSGALDSIAARIAAKMPAP